MRGRWMGTGSSAARSSSVAKQRGGAPPSPTPLSPGQVKVTIRSVKDSADVAVQEVQARHLDGQSPATAPADDSSHPGVAQVAAQPTHMLLYLSEETFTGDFGVAFAAEVRAAHAAGFPVAMIHENDLEKQGCEFSTFFSTTPQDLIDAGLYKALAVAFVSGDTHRKVSYALFSKVLGAVKVGDRGTKSLVQSMTRSLTAPRTPRRPLDPHKPVPVTTGSAQRTNQQFRLQLVRARSLFSGRCDV